MNTESVVNKKRLSTVKILDEYFMKESINVLKKIRFDVGCVDISKMKALMRLDKYACGHYEDDLREEIVTKSILYIPEL